MSALRVQKFGGTSVADSRKITQIAKKISAQARAGNQVVVVVSAMGDTTDRLISLSREVCRFPPRREMDMLLSAGERISMALLSMALAEEGVHALSLTGSQSGIVTTAVHGEAKIQKILICVFVSCYSLVYLT